ncbi:MAG: TIGR00296 family protein [Candidatus Diapherotrites archaeon]|nr:TIGR00296 family protein [Candidatus Diapherotrites archaeon]
MPYFSDEDGEWMVRAARRVLEEYLIRGRRVVPEPPTGKLSREFGVFTTLKTYPSGDLRGCIGYPYPIKPLNVALAETAILATTEDPRFPPVSPDELDSLIVEVSALTPPQRLDVPKGEVPEHIVVGKHGLIIRNGAYSGLLLPQVPIEEGWDVGEFLAYASLKAGLPPDAWTWPNTEIYTFTAEVFAETEPNGQVRRVM